MRNLLYFILILSLFSCDEDEEIVPVKKVPEEIEPKCDFNNFDKKFKYNMTLSNNESPVEINENSIYENDIINNFKVTITSQNSRDTTDSLKFVSLIVGCNTTGTEFDIANCRIVSDIQFPSTKVYCGGADEYLFDRIKDADLTYHSKDTLVFYEKGKNWYHYFISDSTEEIENKQDLPKLRIKSNEIYAADDTLYIPINYNFLKNDSTDCYFYGMKVEPQYKDWNNSFIILPELNISKEEDDNYRKICKFTAVSKLDTICRIDSVIFFRYKWFNNAYIYIGNILLKQGYRETSYHPFYGSTDTTIWSYSNKYTHTLKYNKTTLAPCPVSPPYLPLVYIINNNILEKVSLSKNHDIFDALYGSTSGMTEVSVKNCNIELEKNKNFYDLLFNDINFIKENIDLKYNKSYQSIGDATQISKYEWLEKVTYTDSSYVKLKFWRD